MVYFQIINGFRTGPCAANEYGNWTTGNLPDTFAHILNRES